MQSHEPKNYQCPFCKIAKGIEYESVSTKPADIFYQDKFITAFVASHWWSNNPGHVIIIPNRHIENIYSLPDSLSEKIHSFEKKVAIAMKELYNCDGISSRQHNEPAGWQDVWHYHLNIFPRYKDDKLYELHSKKYLSKEKDRIPYAKKLKKYFY